MPYVSRSPYSVDKAVADPEFPVGGIDLVGGSIDSWGGYVLKMLYVEMKESGPLGGGVHRACPLDPPMQSNRTRHSFD